LEDCIFRCCKTLGQSVKLATTYFSMKTFYQLLVNTTMTSVINFTVWFAITFFVYLQTHSVFATAIISGIYLVLTAISGIWFGSLVDHYEKKHVILASSIASLILYGICFAIYITVGANSFKNPLSVALWIFVLLLLIGVIVGNIRTVALPTIVTILIPENRRDKANGLVGSTVGISFLVTSIISGLLVGHSGMYWVLILAMIVIAASIVHLLTVSIPEKRIVHTGSAHVAGSADETISGQVEGQSKKIDLRGTLAVILNIPGLSALIVFAAINNFLGGVFMALMDAYGLSLVSVQIWGLLWGFLSTGFIIGGLIIAKLGLGKNPLRALFLANITIWTICCVFTIYPSIILLVAGMYAYLCVVPYIEASEQTIMQKVVPYERQGRVFGFSQSVEQAASPLTAFLIGPIAELIFIPFMTTGKGVDLIGSWFGTGPDRGIALVFTLTGLIGLLLTLFAMNTKYYLQLSQRYLGEK
jgi:DHA3 family multidrug efflux protein-like MFS transporter